jgi:hypothetical protein
MSLLAHVITYNLRQLGDGTDHARKTKLPKKMTYGINWPYPKHHLQGKGRLPRPKQPPRDRLEGNINQSTQHHISQETPQEIQKNQPKLPHRMPGSSTSHQESSPP